MNIKNFSEAKANIPSSLTIALALVTVAIVSALVAHVHTLVGLCAALLFLIALTTVSPPFLLKWFYGRTDS
ncbi:MAG: hypothetical protein WA435_03020 [Gallionellaceae bacterium]